jgi:recombination protein RecA
MSQALRKLTGNIKRTNTLVIFINQIRMKIGVMFGNPETTTGGQALKFYSSVRMEIRRVESIKQGQDVSGNRVRVKVVKNKVAPPFRTAEFDIMFNEGISRIGSIVDLGTELNVLRKSGAFYSFGDQRLGQGRENVKEFLKGNPELADEIEAQIRQNIAGATSAPIAIAATAGARNGSAPAAGEEEDEEEF